MPKPLKGIFNSLRNRIQKCAEISLKQWPKYSVFALVSGAIKVFLKLIPFQWIAPKIGKNMQQDFTQPSPQQQQIINRVSKIIEHASCFEPWAKNCLNHAILAKYLLKRHNIPSTLHLGVCKSEKKHTSIDAHAWLTVGSQMVCGKSKREYIFFTCFM